MSKEVKRTLSTTQIILIGFFLVIIAGAILLTLPISSASGEWTGFLDAAFTSATALCVTGLVVVDTASYWSLFGKIVILVLIQLGGLGIVSLTTGFMLIIGRRVTLRDRLLLEDAFNLGTLRGLLRFLIRMFKYTVFFELIGIVLYLFVFIPDYGFAKGLWAALFTSVSAFCNAGLDIIGPTSLVPYADNPLIIITTSFLIISGGLGFLVWWDISRTFHAVIKRRFSGEQLFTRLTLHSKVVILMTVMLIILGTALFLILEYNNSETMGKMNFFNKILSSFFQSVTVRTAGFASVPQENLTDASALVSMILMFIGGSPIGTAGGVKTTTVAVLMITAASFSAGRKSPTVFGRTLPDDTLKKALTVFIVSFCVLISAVILLLATQSEGSFIDIAFETVSALGTVGLSRAYSPSLNAIGRIIIIVCMYLGRVGPISMVIALSNSKRKPHTVFPEENLRVG